MINLKAFLDSLKLTWCRKAILSDSPWLSILKDKVDFQKLFSIGRNYTEYLLKRTKKKQILGRCT